MDLWVGAYELTGGGGGAWGMAASLPQLGQKRMVSGTELPQLAQERVADCVMIVFPFDSECR